MGSHICRHLLKGFQPTWAKMLLVILLVAYLVQPGSFAPRNNRENERNNREHEIEKRSPAGHSLEEEDRNNRENERNNRENERNNREMKETTERIGKTWRLSARRGL